MEPPVGISARRALGRTTGLLAIVAFAVVACALLFADVRSLTSLLPTTGTQHVLAASVLRTRPASGGRSSGSAATSGSGSSSATEGQSATTPKAAPPMLSMEPPAKMARLLPEQYGERKYFIPMMIVEGFGAWSDAIWETINAAIALNRTWVEPCVRNGCIEPCRCGAIRPVPRWTEEAEAAALASGSDPMLLPYINARCKLDLGAREMADDYVGETYPLSAYLDLDAIAEVVGGQHLISYSDWCAAYNSTHGAAADGADASLTVSGGAVREVEPHFKRWKEDHAYTYDMQINYLKEDHPVAVGDFWFKFHKIGRVQGSLDLLKNDPRRNVFIYHFFRGVWGQPYSFRTVPINKWHVAAVNRFVKEQLGGKPTVAFHWRSEHVDTRLIEPCAVELAGIATDALPGLLSPEHSHVVLVSDMPAPTNPNRMWNDYANGDDAPRHRAMATMLAAGFRKYDSHIINATGGMLIDAGVLSLRDYLLSVESEWYVTCQGEHWGTCHGCFRSGSNIVARIKKDREHKQLPYTFHWFKITAEEAPESLAVDPAHPERKRHKFVEPKDTAGVKEE